MRPTGPRLDKHGFPIPPGFDEGDSSDRSAAASGSFRFLPWLKATVLVAVVATIAVHLELPSKTRGLVGRYHAQKAVGALRRRDFDDALAAVDRALEWNPQAVPYLVLRAHIRTGRKEFAEVLADAELALAQKPNDTDAMHLRSLALHYLQRHREAAAAATDMLQRGIGDRAAALNTRAYARALGDFELNEALADIDEALADSADEASFLDTRGYVYFKLGRLDEALKDFTRSIELVEAEREQLEQRAKQLAKSAEVTKSVAEQLESLEHNLAVMYHHRGEAYQKQGDASKAKHDLFVGEQLGFNPAAGVY